MRRAFEQSALLVFRAGWVWPRLTFSLRYPPCYPSPVRIATSNASNPRSSSLRALSAVCCRCARGRAMLVLARNCSSALAALGSQEPFQTISPVTQPLTRTYLTPVKYLEVIVMMAHHKMMIWNSTQQSTIWQKPTMF